MYQCIFLFIAVLEFLLIRLIAGKWRFGYIIGGLVFGIYNEFGFEFCWDYSPLLAPMVWRDVPLVVVLGWGLFTGLALSISDRVTMQFRWETPIVRLVSDVFIFSCIGFLVESIMPALKFWKYNFPIMAGAWYKITGYILVGILVSTTGRMFQVLFERKKA